MTGHRLSSAEVYARALACSIRQATRALTRLWQEAGLSPAYIEAILRERRWVHGPAAPARGRRRQAPRPARTEPTTPLGPSSGHAGSSGSRRLDGLLVGERPAVQQPKEETR